MEPKTNPFFALRDRLYAAAAAGTAVIAEDFRLQRAIEAFQPLAASNKVFARLYAMCAGLAQAQSPALQLAECIALADAVAVTQAPFQDTRATDEIPARTLPRLAQMPYRTVEETAQQIRNGQYRAEGTEARRLMRDPRVLAAFLASSGRRGEHPEAVERVAETVYGEALIPLLTDALDLSDEKASGQQIVYLRRMAGSDQAELFLSLAQNADAPAGVRVQAIEALAGYPEYADILLTLWQTEKGKVKSAAIDTLLEMGSPLADAALTKQFEKSKDTNRALAAKGGTPLCCAYAERELNAALEQPGEALIQCLPMLANKPDAAALFLRAARAESDRSSQRMRRVRAGLNDVLCANLCRRDGYPFRALIRTLYEEEPEMFFPAWFFLALVTDPEQVWVACEAEATEQIDDIAQLLTGLSRVADLPWTLTPNFGSSAEKVPLEVYAELPKTMTDFLASCCRQRGAVSFDAARAFVQASKTMLTRCTDSERERVGHCVRELTGTLLDKTPFADLLSVYAEAHGKMAGKIRDLVLNSLRISQYAVGAYTLRSLLRAAGSAIMLADLRELETVLPQQSDIPEALRLKALGEVRATLRFLNS